MPFIEILDDDLDRRFYEARRRVLDTQPGTAAHEKAQRDADAMFTEGLRSGAIVVTEAD